MNRSFLLTAFLAAALAASAHAGPISVSVMQKSSTDSAKGDRSAKAQEKSLEITLSNGTRQEYPGLKIKYYFFAKDLKEKDTEILDQGDEVLSVPAMGKAKVETKTVRADYVQQHVKGGGGGGNRGGGQKVAASGKRITGYGVQVFDADKMVAEYFSSSELKKKLPEGGAAPAPAPAAGAPAGAPPAEKKAPEKK